VLALDFVSFFLSFFLADIDEYFFFLFFFKQFYVFYILTLDFCLK